LPEPRRDDAYQTDALLQQTAAALQQALAVAVQAPVSRDQLGLPGQVTRCRPPSPCARAWPASPAMPPRPSPPMTALGSSAWCTGADRVQG
jgi:hypothetical protein